MSWLSIQITISTISKKNYDPINDTSIIEYENSYSYL